MKFSQILKKSSTSYKESNGLTKCEMHEQVQNWTRISVGYVEKINHVIIIE